MATHHGLDDSILSYIHIPPSAQRLPGPNAVSYRARLASFPPSGALSSASAARADIANPAPLKGKQPNKEGGYLSNSVSDLFLSSILPSSIPTKAPPSSNVKIGFGKPRPLTTQREPLSLQIMTTNFRRFVARCGPIFWIQDRVEEIIYWRKPVWTLTWMLGWGLISFYPRLLLICPFITIILIILYQYEKSHPSITGTRSSMTLTSRQAVLGNPIVSDIAASLAVDKDGSVNPKAKDETDESILYTAHGSTVDADGKEVPAAPPGTAESAVDYYMNLQGIQNLMGVVSDVHDTALPYVSLINPTSTNPSPPPTTFPLSPTHLLMLCLPPAIFLPLAPNFVLSWILFVSGILPPIIFHPSLTSDSFKRLADSVPRGMRFWRAKAERWVLTDRLDDRIANSEIREVNVWEHERLDPAWVSNAMSNLENTIKDPSKGRQFIVPPPPSAWSSAHLKVADRQPWIRTIPLHPQDSLWKDDASPLEHVGHDEELALEKRATTGKVALLLTKGWSFVPGEEWRVDLAGQWSPVGVDEGERRLYYDTVATLLICLIPKMVGYTLETNGRTSPWIQSLAFRHRAASSRRSNQRVDGSGGEGWFTDDRSNDR